MRFARAIKRAPRRSLRAFRRNRDAGHPPGPRRVSFRRLLTALCVAGALLVPGARNIAGAQASSIPGAPTADQTDRQRRTLDLGPAGAVDVSTLSGDITVTAGTGPATLEIIRRSHART